MSLNFYEHGLWLVIKRKSLRVRCGCEDGRRRRLWWGRCPGHALGVRRHGTAGSGWWVMVSKVTAVCPEIDTDTAERECARTYSCVSFPAQALAVVLATNKQSRESADRLISCSETAFSKCSSKHLSLFPESLTYQFSLGLPYYEDTYVLIDNSNIFIPISIFAVWVRRSIFI